ncbi:MAG: uracil-DNA glycosylase family protein [Eubacteriales bacterium]
MFEQIKCCQKCYLNCNQKPLLDEKKECEIFWVGLSAKIKQSEAEIPLSDKTNTGKLICMIEEACIDIKTYKTNLVKCVPLDEKQKLRYPNRLEINSCVDHLSTEINQLSPKIVFLLGEKVYTSVGRYYKLKFEKWSNFEYQYIKYNDIYFVPVHHPSYIQVYKRKYIDEYVNSIKSIVNELL